MSDYIVFVKTILRIINNKELVMVKELNIELDKVTSESNFSN